MAATATLTGDYFQSVGSEFCVTGTLSLGIYATGGVEVTPALVSLGSFIGAPTFSAAGYAFSWDATNNKVLVYASAGITPAGSGTAAAQTFTGTAASLTATASKPTFTVEASGAIGTNMEVGLSADTAGATFEGGVGITAQRTLTTTSPVGTPTITPGAYTPAGTNATSAVTFTGTAVAAAAFAEVANGVDLAAVVVSVRAFGGA